MKELKTFIEDRIKELSGEIDGWSFTRDRINSAIITELKEILDQIEMLEWELG